MGLCLHALIVSVPLVTLCVCVRVYLCAVCVYQGWHVSVHVCVSERECLYASVCARRVSARCVCVYQGWYVSVPVCVLERQYLYACMSVPVCLCVVRCVCVCQGRRVGVPRWLGIRIQWAKHAIPNQSTPHFLLATACMGHVRVCVCCV